MAYLYFVVESLYNTGCYFEEVKWNLMSRMEAKRNEMKRNVKYNF
jgi:hypothetical protein